MDIFKEMGGLSEIARKEGCKASSVSEWKLRGIPVERCPRLERAYDGKVTCEQMRPDVVWVRIPDPDWHWHPDGRPLIDVTAVTAANDTQGQSPQEEGLRGAA